MTVVNADSQDCDASKPIPRVLHVADAGHFARFGRMYRELGLALNDAGIHVSLLTDDAEAAAGFEGTPIAGHFFRPLRGWGIWRMHNYLRRQFDPPPDVVHLWGTGAIGYLSDWTQHNDATLVIHACSMNDIEKMKRRGLHHNERLIAACGELGDILNKHLSAAASPVLVYRPALLWPRRTRVSSPRDHIPGVIWTGAITRDCGLEVLIQAIASLREKGAEFQVGLIGEGAATRKVWREIRRHRVSDRFSIITEPRVWDQTCAGADILVLPRRQRELSLAPLLAMALGIIVIASRDQIADWFIEDQTSLQFTPNSTVELAYHLSRAAAGHPSVMELARRASDYVREYHAITVLADKLAALYRDLTPRSAIRRQNGK